MRLWVAVVVALWGLPLAAAEIASARYTDPTSRYPHAVLGDDIEYAGLEVTLTDGGRRKVTWPPGMVFEDLAPRVLDVTGDGLPEIITVESSDTQGARLSVWGLDEEGSLKRLASTPHIGTRFRWLAPVGAMDLDGDGLIEIGYVDRPHLAKTLRIWRFENGALDQIYSVTGLTNHRIGEDFISGGIRACDTGPEMVLATANWSRLVGVTLTKSGPTTRDLGPFSAEALSKILNCS